MESDEKKLSKPAAIAILAVIIAIIVIGGILLSRNGSL